MTYQQILSKFKDPEIKAAKAPLSAIEIGEVETKLSVIWARIEPLIMLAQAIFFPKKTSVMRIYISKFRKIVKALIEKEEEELDPLLDE